MHFSEPKQHQATYCLIERSSDASFVLKALKQKLYVDGLAYLLQDIYGIENKNVQMKVSTSFLQNKYPNPKTFACQRRAISLKRKVQWQKSTIRKRRTKRAVESALFACRNRVTRSSYRAATCACARCAPTASATRPTTARSAASPSAPCSRSARSENCTYRPPRFISIHSSIHWSSTLV